MSLYSEIIMAYAKAPPNKKPIENPTIYHHEQNRHCGDSIDVFLNITPTGEIADFGFTGDTAMVTTACASIVGEAIIGMSIQEVLILGYPFVRELLTEDVSERRKMASVLGILTIRNALHKYLGDDRQDDFSDVL